MLQARKKNREFIIYFSFYRNMIQSNKELGLVKFKLLINVKMCNCIVQYRNHVIFVIKYLYIL